MGAAAYGVLEGQVDVDGNEIAGVRSVFEQVPIRTYLGWNLFRAGRLEGGMCNLQSSFIPFARTKAEREAIGDSRLSLEERYPTRDVYVAAMRQAAAGLVRARLLPDDATAIVGAAERDGIRTGPWRRLRREGLFRFSQAALLSSDTARAGPSSVHEVCCPKPAIRTAPIIGSSDCETLSQPVQQPTTGRP